MDSITPEKQIKLTLREGEAVAIVCFLRSEIISIQSEDDEDKSYQDMVRTLENLIRKIEGQVEEQKNEANS